MQKLRRSPFGTFRSTPRKRCLRGQLQQTGVNNIIDPYRLDSQQVTVNYNRDVGAFPVLKGHDGENRRYQPVSVSN